MALIRKLLVLGAVIALLPSDREQQAGFVEQARGAMVWTATFCDRNAAICAEGRELWTAAKHKAEFGASVAMSMVREYSARNSSAVVPPATESVFDRGTLRPEDLYPAWNATPVRSRQASSGY